MPAMYLIIVFASILQISHCFSNVQFIRGHLNNRLRCSHKENFSKRSLVSYCTGTDLEENIAYTSKQLLKEETEAPFRKFRFFIYFSLLGAAGIGSLICITKFIAIASGARTGDTTELLSNLAINLAGIPVLGLLWKRDLDSQNSRLQRIQKGGSLAGLKVKIGTKESPVVVKLSDLRRNRGIEKRVVIIAAKKELIDSSILSSVKEAANLIANDLLIIPLRLLPSDPSSSTSTSSFSVSPPSMEELLQDVSPSDQLHIGLPVALPAWESVLRNEVKDAIKQNPTALDKGITIVIKKNGKVGTRRFGVPIWEALVEDVQSRKDAGLDITNI